MADTKYRLVGAHAEDLGAAGTAEVGQVIKLGAKEQEEPQVMRLIEEGKLVPVVDQKPKSQTGGDDS